jgi:hypothetical protein
VGPRRVDPQAQDCAVDFSMKYEWAKAVPFERARREARPFEWGLDEAGDTKVDARPILLK